MQKEKNLLDYTQTRNTAAAELTHMVMPVWPAWTAALKTFQTKQEW